MGTHDESISSRDFKRLSDLVYTRAGICLGVEKKTMLEVRVKRRLKDLHMASYADYCDFLFGPSGQKEEMVQFLDVVTTNKTDFFREPGHFRFLAEQALPNLRTRMENGRPFLIWSAGCSSGEEPYTMAMVLSDYAERNPGFRFRILATDISTAMLRKAEQAIYSCEVASPVPAGMHRKYFLRSRDAENNRMRIVPELRRLVEFRRLNFMDADYGVREKADAIFCRNVIIYFDRQTQQSILRKLCHHLAPNGYLFVGHAETLHDMNLPLTPVAPALYRKLDDAA